ncbi:hypothetical protein EGH21_04440 [Halomicroarcula sp. F13]|uniref:Uncharacterized protein n=1 Tax=Haloarcula rubra TaxID=2487747 RepID=A0AAW4PP13_9EURY|nr:hypothetical protein [Halomicroarcula rubra]MBX0322280.1 hypothetical protein [Halomicroarcula rubra]
MEGADDDDVAVGTAAGDSFEALVAETGVGRRAVVGLLGGNSGVSGTTAALTFRHCQVV